MVWGCRSKFLLWAGCMAAMMLLLRRSVQGSVILFRFLQLLVGSEGFLWSDQQQHGGSSFSQFIFVFFVVLCGHCDLLTPSFLGHEGHEALHKEHHDIIIVVGDALLNTNEGENFYCGPAAWLR